MTTDLDVDCELSPSEIAELAGTKARCLRVTHHYDIGNQDIFVERMTGEVDGRRAAVYCQFKAEEWFGDGAMLSNLGAASLLVTFYGYRHIGVTSLCTTVDLYLDRERACGSEYAALMADRTLERDGLREAMAPHVTV